MDWGRIVDWEREEVGLLLCWPRRKSEDGKEESKGERAAEQEERVDGGVVQEEQEHGVSTDRCS